MSLDLKDLCTKVSIETLAIIKGYASATGKHEAVVAREILTEWAGKIRHATTVADSILRVEGIAGKTGASRGISGE